MNDFDFLCVLCVSAVRFFQSDYHNPQTQKPILAFGEAAVETAPTTAPSRPSSTIIWWLRACVAANLFACHLINLELLRKKYLDNYSESFGAMKSPTPRRWTPRTIFRRAVQVIQEDGFATLWFKILGETIYRRVFVIERFVDEPIEQVAARVPLTFGWLDTTQIDDYLRLRPEANRDEILRRLRDGQWCLTARSDGQLVYAGWSAAGRARIDYLDREIQLAPDEIYAYEIFTAPDFRGANIPPVAIHFRLRYFGNLGYRRFVAVVVPENWRALRSFRKAGYRVCGTMGYVRIGAWRWDFTRLGKNDPRFK
jgi:RimJ/RimL family protein N-acetyltransferase